MTQAVNPRTQRSVSGMVGALIVVVLLALAWVGFSALNSNNKVTPVQAVDWAAWVKAGRADQVLATFAPTSLPDGWRATSVHYTSGHAASWHLGMVTDNGKYVGIEEELVSPEDLAHRIVDPNAVRGKDVQIAGVTWQTWTDAGGDYAVTRSVLLGSRPYESVLVGGSADPAAVREFASSLTPGTVRPGA